MIVSSGPLQDQSPLLNTDPSRQTPERSLLRSCGERQLVGPKCKVWRVRQRGMGKEAETSLCFEGTQAAFQSFKPQFYWLSLGSLAWAPRLPLGLKATSCRH